MQVNSLRRISLKMAMCVGLWAVSSLTASAKTYINPMVSASHVEAFADDGFDYSESNLSQYTYTYIDPSGEEVTVPLTTPATTREAMVALLREVYSNRAIPGRKWVYGNEYVDYHPSDEACAKFGFRPGDDFTPDRDGLTCLLIEGVSNLGDADQSMVDDYLDQFKCITLVTSRMALADNLDGDGTPNPGYLFNIKKPLHKFFFVTKGKARATNFAALWNMFEEYSPNNGRADDRPQQVYHKLLSGGAYYVTHDCSTVIGNRGHIMEMETADNAPANINLTVFIPHLRSYDDVANPPAEAMYNGEMFTWYDPARRPFFYYYSIALKAEAEPIEGDPAHYKVNLTWHTNFRDLFNVTNDGEFAVYPVVDNAADLDSPIAFESSPQSETTIKGDRVYSHADGSVTVSYRVPVGSTGYYLRYIVGGRLDGMATDLTYSNIDRVFIPGSSDMENFIIEIVGTGSSTFTPTERTNTYDNRIRMYNRDDHKAIKYGDFVKRSYVSSDNRWGTQMIAYELADNDFVIARDGRPLYKIRPARVAAGGPDAQGRWFNYLTCYLTDPDGRKIRRDYTIDDDGTASDSDVITLRWKALRSSQHGGDHDLANPVVNIDDSMGPLLGEIDDHFKVSVSTNSHPDYYRYAVTLVTDGVEQKKSNVEQVDIYKSEVYIQPSTYSLDEVIADESTRELPTVGYDAIIKVANLPNIKGYRLRLSNSDDSRDGVIAYVQNDYGQFSSSVRTSSDNSALEPVGDVVEIPSGMETYISVPLNDEFNAQMMQSLIRDNVGLVVDVNVDPGTNTDGTDGAYDTFGTPIASPTEMPIVEFSSIEIMRNNVAGSIYNRAARKVINTNLSLLHSDEYDLPMVSHYAVWRDLDGRGDNWELVNGWANAQGESWRDNSTFTGVLNYNDQRTTIAQFDGFDDKDKVTYTVRAYIKAVAKDSSKLPQIHPRQGAPSRSADANTRYIIAETTGTAYYRGNTTTGVENVATTDQQLSVDIDGSSVTINGHGPIALYSASGTLLMQINDNQPSRTLDTLSRGVYIATNGESTVKFAKH